MLPPKSIDLEPRALLPVLKTAQYFVEDWCPKLTSGEPVYCAVLPAQTGEKYVSAELLMHHAHSVSAFAAAVGIAAAEAASQNDWMLEVIYPVAEPGDGRPAWLIRHTNRGQS